MCRKKLSTVSFLKKKYIYLLYLLGTFFLVAFMSVLEMQVSFVLNRYKCSRAAYEISRDSIISSTKPSLDCNSCAEIFSFRPSQCFLFSPILLSTCSLIFKKKIVSLPCATGGFSRGFFVCSPFKNKTQSPRE